MMLEEQCRRKWLLFLIRRLSFFLFLLHVGHIVTFTPVGSFQDSSGGAPASFPVTFDSNPKASFPPHSAGDPTGIPAYYPKSSATPSNFHQQASQQIQRFPKQLPCTFTGTPGRFSGASSVLRRTAYGTSVNSPSS